MRKWFARVLALCAVPLLVGAQLLLDLAEWVNTARRAPPGNP